MELYIHGTIYQLVIILVMTTELVMILVMTRNL
jgi:hypothetical protein